MSKPVQSFPLGYYPLLPPQPPALQLTPNPLQRYVQMVQQFYTPTSLLPTNPQLLMQGRVQIATQIAQNAFWRVPFPMLPTHYTPAAPHLNVPVPPQPPAAAAPAPAEAPPAPALAQPVPIRKKRLRPPPQKLTFVEAKEQDLLPKPANIPIPGFPVNGTALIRTLMQEGTTLLKQQKYAEGIQRFRQGFSIDPTVHFMFYLVIGCQNVLKEIRPEILRYSGDALSRNPHDMNALFLKGICYIEPGKYQIALSCFSSILRFNSEDRMTKILHDEVYKMYKRDTQIPGREEASQQASVKRKMAIGNLLNPLR